jgi:hypothetical protein
MEVPALAGGGYCVKKMDLREAKMCLDEYRVSLEKTCGLLKQRTGEGAPRDVAEKLNDDRLMALLEVDRKEALVLSGWITQEMYARDDKQILADEWTEILVAQHKLWDAIAKAEQVQAEYLNPEAKKKGKRYPNSPEVVVGKGSGVKEST